MNFFDRLNPKQVSMVKIAGVGFLAVLVIAFVFRFLGTSFTAVTQSEGSRGSMGYAIAPSAMPASDMALRESYGVGGGIAPPTVPGSPSGNDAESYESTSYSGSIETGDLDKTCEAISAFKPLSYVIFEQANRSDKGCSYVFKVERVHVEEILKKVQALNPKELNQDTQTIKRVIDDYTSETEILEKKKASIESTLETAVKAYDEITALAIKTQNAETLANLIESKLRVLERLTQERINVNEQLDRLAKAKGEQLDRLNYTYFSLNVYENKYLDGKALKDSWKESVRTFVRDLNLILQDVTIGLIAAFLIAAQYLLYFFIALVIAKYVWRWAVSIWKK